ncbi:MAG: hypothetical protein ABH986_03685 [archaeon]
MAKKKFDKCPICGQENVALNVDGTPTKNCHECKKEKISKWRYIFFVVVIILIGLWFIPFIFEPSISQFLKTTAAIVMLGGMLFSAHVYFNFGKETTNNIMIFLTIMTLGIMVWNLHFTQQSLDATTDALNLAKEDYNRTVELDKNIQESLFESLNTKLDASFANAIVFLDNNSTYLEGPDYYFQTKFPEGFEQYIELLRISDDKTVAGLLALDQFTSRVNNAIDYTQYTWTTANEDINKQAFKKEVWSKEQKVIEYIAHYSCGIKKDLTEKYGRQFNQPDINSLVINKTPGITVNVNRTCIEPIPN